MSRLSLLVKGVSQDLDFETGSMTNFVLLQLPSGKTFRAAVEDEIAQAVIGAASGGAAPEQSMQELFHEQQPPMDQELERLRAQAERQSMRTMVGDNGETVMDFGGDADETGEYLAEEHPRAHLSPEQVMRGKTVSSGLLDDMGNLTSVPGGGVDPGEVVSVDDEDVTESI